jgi:hypothetical protein
VAERGESDGVDEPAEAGAWVVAAADEELSEFGVDGRAGAAEEDVAEGQQLGGDGFGRAITEVGAVRL